VKLIDADAAIDALKELTANGTNKGMVFGEDAVHRIEMLPSVQPERKTGHWIAITSRNNTYKCSVCGRLLVNITDGKNKVAKNYPYCHCGADMRGEAE
jgi:hypothetical protein